MGKKTIGLILMLLVVALFCGAASASALEMNVNSTDATVSISEAKKDGNTVFNITKSIGTDAEKGKLYLLMIQNATSDGKPVLPTKDNTCYVDWQEANDQSVSFVAYPKEMSGTSYTVYLSDYSGSNNGAAKSVGIIAQSVETLYGDVNSSGNVDDLDEMILARYNAGWDDYGPNKTHDVNMTNADVNQDNAVNDLDEMILARYNAGWDGYTLPYTG